jgi:GDP-L-fucose synthase
MPTNIYIAGHNGMVGSAIFRKISKDSNVNLITASKNELNLIDQKDVNNFFKNSKIDQVYLAAGRVGGIHANNEYPAEFIYENIMIQANIIHASHKNDINKLLFLGSSCIYPKYAEQPIKESSILDGELEKTNQPYAVAKIAGIKMCESYNRQFGRDYRSAMPTNLYGENDNYHGNNSHVIPALIKRFHEAKINGSSSVSVWGSGNALREFLCVDDAADACHLLMNINKLNYDSVVEPMLSQVNIGTGKDISIKELVIILAKVVGFKGDIKFNTEKPDGTPRKVMDISRISSLGWKPKYELEEGLSSAYSWFVKNQDSHRT